MSEVVEMTEVPEMERKRVIKKPKKNSDKRKLIKSINRKK